MTKTLRAGQRNVVRGLLAAAAALAILAIGWAAKRGGPVNEPKARARVAVPQPLTASPRQEEVPSSHYDVVRQRNLFRPLIQQAKQEEPLEPMPVALLLPAELEEPAQEAWADEWVYAGNATVDDERIAIVENIETKQAVFLREGGPFEDALVERITPQELVLRRGGDRVALPISDAFNATPLDEPPQSAERNGARESGSRRESFRGRMRREGSWNPESRRRAMEWMERRRREMDSVAPHVLPFETGEER